MKSRKLLLIVTGLLVAALAAGVTGCAGQSPTQPSTPTSPGTPSAPQDQVFNWKLQSSWTGIGIPHQDEVCRRFVERTKQMSNGRLNITNYDADVLVGPNQSYQAAGDGIIDMAVVSPGFYSGVEPVAEYFWAIPFFTEHEEFYTMVYLELGARELWRNAYAKHNIFHLNYMLSDEWGSMASKVPINSLADIKGLKIRTMGIHGTFMQEQGAGITMFPPAEIYSAFATGVIDASVFASPNGWYGMKVYEVAPYYIDPPFVPYDITETIVSMDSWNALPNDLKAILEASSRLHSSEWAALSVMADGLAREQLVKAGTTFCTLPDNEIIYAKDRCYEILQAAASKDANCAAYVDIVNKALDIKARYYPPRAIPTE